MASSNHSLSFPPAEHLERLKEAMDDQFFKSQRIVQSQCNVSGVRRSSVEYNIDKPVSHDVLLATRSRRSISSFPYSSSGCSDFSSKWEGSACTSPKAPGNNGVFRANSSSTNSNSGLTVSGSRNACFERKTSDLDAPTVSLDPSWESFVLKSLSANTVLSSNPSNLSPTEKTKKNTRTGLTLEVEAETGVRTESSRESKFAELKALSPTVAANATATSAISPRSSSHRPSIFSIQRDELANSSVGDSHLSSSRSARSNTSPRPASATSKKFNLSFSSSSEDGGSAAQRTGMYYQPDPQFSPREPNVRSHRHRCCNSSCGHVCEPNVYEHALTVVSDLGMDRFWANIIDIFTQDFYALRLGLTIPHDTTDIYNTPWRLKAAYDGIYRHHETACADTTAIPCSQQNVSNMTVHAQNGNYGTIFNSNYANVPTGEDLELIDIQTIHHILNEGRVIVYTRQQHRCPESHQQTTNATESSSSKENSTKAAPKMPMSSRRPAAASEADPDMLGPQTSAGRNGRKKSAGDPSHSYFAEYEQVSMTPFFISPSVSPAVIKESSNNPFFPSSSSRLDQSAFIKDCGHVCKLAGHACNCCESSKIPNPVAETAEENSAERFHSQGDAASTDEASPSTDNNDSVHVCNVGEAGFESAFSIIHVPFIHPSVYLKGSGKSSHVPLAILSIQSKLVPYPSSLLSSIRRLAPFLAASLFHALNLSAPLPLCTTHERTGDCGCVFNDLSDASEHAEHASETESPDPPRTRFVSHEKHSDTTPNASNGKHIFSPYGARILSHTHNKSHPYANGSIGLRSSQLRSRARAFFSVPKQTGFSLRFGRRLPVFANQFGNLLGSTGSTDRGETNSKKAKRKRVNDSATVPDSFVPPSKLLRVIIDSIPVHVFTACATTGRITWVNERAALYCGVSAAALVEKQFAHIHPDDINLFLGKWKSVISDGDVFYKELRLRRFDSQYRYFICRAIPLRNSKGVVIQYFGTMMDVHEQKMAEQEARKQSEAAANINDYRSLAEASPQIVFAVNPIDGIVYANAQWLSFSGLSFEESMGLGFLSVVHPEDRMKCLLPGTSSKFPNSDKTYAIEVRFRSTVGQYRWHLVKCVCVNQFADTSNVLWLGTCTDIHDHKLLEEKLQEANREAQRMMNSKTRFLSNMSHEIRTPLVGITGMVNFLLDTNLTSEQLDYAHTIQQSSEALLSVINDILDLSKVEAGMMKLTHEAFSVRSMMEDTNETLSTLAFSKNLELNYVVDHDVPDMVIGDQARLRQVALNVIGNALKFSHEGEVFCQCSVKPTQGLAPNEIMLQWECYDTGPGFSKEDEEKIFKPFSQIDDSLTRKHGGSGLGLVISRELIELHEGTMSCTSVKDRGSAFYWSAKFKLNAKPVSIEPPVEFVQPEIGKPALDCTKALRRNKSLAPDAFAIEVTQDEASPEPLERASNTSNNVSTSGALKKPTASSLPNITTDLPKKLQPSVFNIVVISHTRYSSFALAHHIRSIVDYVQMKDLITFQSFQSAYNQIFEHPLLSTVTHFVINFTDNDSIMNIVRHIKSYEYYCNALVILVVTMKQKKELSEHFKEKGEWTKQHIKFVTKLAKPSKLAPFFTGDDIKKSAVLDYRRENAKQFVADQKQILDGMREKLLNTNHNILLAEDNMINCKVLTRYLERIGLKVHLAHDGVACLELWKSKPEGFFSLILMDLQMPNMDGYQACVEIHKLEESLGYKMRVPIIALSANVMSDVVQNCKQCGFDSYISKPISFKLLSARISGYVLGSIPCSPPFVEHDG
ncbi:histidine kinase Mak1 [Schizosaccharomyces japonicus yFS275]|uniref:histidine kinase n=1 Tax=Schizosaccharomyces japonicus (strain yFS275 / FY16936) TaxID=402676 RepID=B6JVC4_SCHJY|nr:histidine kinase Mak1 [Schizosaccharomyces japonicus yFS275]EEB05325.1 histidine kinase Mak1 [Schizosaccharomyces japonicus yFS275]